MHANGALVGEMCWVAAFVEEGSGGGFPGLGCGARDPHEDKHVVEGFFERVRHDAEKLIGDAVRAKGLVVVEGLDSIIESVGPEDIWD
jgi:hypothetical protein